MVDLEMDNGSQNAQQIAYIRNVQKERKRSDVLYVPLHQIEGRCF